MTKPINWGPTLFNRRQVMSAAATAAAGTAWIGMGLPAWSATLAEIKQRGYMIAATEDDYPPFEFVKDGKPQGLDHALYDVFKKSVPFEIRQEII
ncbi:MAG: transporter substrate-binding domain-containing protein, partial [Candidatus Binatia bacterium]